MVAMKAKKAKAQKGEEAGEEKAPAEKTPTEKQPEGKDAAKKRPPKKDKGEKKEQGEKKEVSPEEKAKLTKEAVADILEHVSKPDGPSTVYVPQGWITKYKPALGSYKKFCQAQTGTLQVIEREHGGFVVVKAGAPAPPDVKKGDKKGKDWKNMLNGAWSAFCQAIPPGEERLLTSFLKALPKGVVEHGKAVGSPKLSPKASPKMSPKTSPKAAPAEAPAASNKRKASADDEGPKKKKLKKKKVSA